MKQLVTTYQQNQNRSWSDTSTRLEANLTAQLIAQQKDINRNIKITLCSFSTKFYSRMGIRENVTDAHFIFRTIREYTQVSLFFDVSNQLVGIACYR